VDIAGAVEMFLLHPEGAADPSVRSILCQNGPVWVS
jgi:hypothetical protein